MKTNHAIVLIALVLVAAIFTAGCILPEAAPSDDGAAEAPAVTPPAEEQEEEEPEEEPEEEQVVPLGCVKDSDCEDSNPCTTDSCVDGRCLNQVEAYCELEVEETPHITAVNADDSDEYVEIHGTQRIAGWQVDFGDGYVFTFPKNYDLTNLVRLHVKSGLSTTQDLYWGETTKIITDDETIYLKDDAGTVISQYP